MKERCPESRLLSKGVLRDYEIAFTIYSPVRKCGCADIVISRGNEVWGLIYSMTADDIAKLDKFEGIPDNYKRIQIEIIDESGKFIRADSYSVVNKSTNSLRPSMDYLFKMITAAEQFSFPNNYVKKLKEIKTTSEN